MSSSWDASERREHSRLTRAQRGDHDAFAQLTEPYARELQLHCYRVVGSLQDSEDLLQETLLAAWRGLEQFEGRSSLRAWLYTIATNRCLNALRTNKRRPAQEWAVPDIAPPEPTGLGEIVWLQPYPDTLLDDLRDAAPGPEARYVQTEAMSLAFVTALQVLPARQRAVLILCEVLGYRAAEVAEMLGSTVASVTSALKRARATLTNRPAHEPPAAADSPAERALVAKFVHAYGSGEVEALVALLTEDVRISMPPMPLEYEGIEVVARFFAAIHRPGRTLHLIPTRANGQLAFGVYVHAPDGARRGIGLTVLTLAGDRICGLTRFESECLGWFGLPRTLPG